MSTSCMIRGHAASNASAGLPLGAARLLDAAADALLAPLLRCEYYLGFGFSLLLFLLAALLGFGLACCSLALALRDRRDGPQHVAMKMNRRASWSYESLLGAEQNPMASVAED